MVDVLVNRVGVNAEEELFEQRRRQRRMRWRGGSWKDGENAAGLEAAEGKRHDQPQPPSANRHRLRYSHLGM